MKRNTPLAENKCPTGGRCSINRGTINAPLRCLPVAKQLFAWTQTNVCLRANFAKQHRLSLKTCSLVLHWMLFSPSIRPHFSANSRKKTSESLCGSDFLYYLCPVVSDMGDALGRRPRGRHTHWGKLMQTTMMPFPKLFPREA